MKKKVNEKTIVGKDGEITTIRETTKEKKYTQAQYNKMHKPHKSLADIILSKNMIFFVLGLIFVLLIGLVVIKLIDANKLNGKDRDIAQQGIMYDSVDGQAPLVSSLSEVIKSKVSSSVKAVYYEQGQTVRSGAKLLELDTTYAKNEISKFNAALQHMQNMLTLYTEKNNNLTIKAQSDGFVTDVRVKQGDNVNPGDLLGSYIPTTSFTVLYNVVYDQTKKIEQWQRVNVSYEGGTVNGVVYEITGNSVQGETIQVGVYITGANVNLSGKLTNAEFITANGNVKSSAGANVHVVSAIPIYAQEQGTISSVYTNSEKAIKSGSTIIAIKNDDIVAKKNAYTNDVSQLQNQINYYNNHELNNYVIYAQTGGIVQTPALKVGDSVVANTEIILIQTDSTIKAEIGVSSAYIDNIAIGQKANLYVEENGKVKQIGGVVTNKESRLIISDVPQDYSVEITINPQETSPDLIGKTAKIGIIVAEKKDAIFVKTDLVYGNKVYVLKGSEIEERTVTIGLQNIQYTEILEGLSKGEEIIER